MPGADRDITSTLTDLERKLQDLETELAGVGDPAAAPAAPPEPVPPLPTAPAASLAPLYGQMAELERFRETLEQSARSLVDEYRRLLEHVHVPAPAAPITPAVSAPVPPSLPPLPPLPPQPPASTSADALSITGGWAPTAPGPAVPPPLPEPVLPPTGGLPVPPAAVEPGPVPAAVPLPGPAVASADPTVQGQLTIDAGPFGDIATLSQFEQALGRLPGAQDVYVKGFEGHRALIDLQLAGPLAIATHLRQVSPLAVTVHDPVPGSRQLKVDIEGNTDA